jgi:WD40 repeat protein
MTLGQTALAEKAEHRLTELAHPCLILRWRTLSESPALVRILTGHEYGVNSVAFSPDGRRIVSGSADRTVAVWDLQSGTRIRQLAGHQDRVMSVAFSPDGRAILSASADRTVAVWDLQSGAHMHQLAGQQGGIRSVAFSPDGRRIASASEDHTVTVWDVRSGQLLASLALDGMILSVAWHGDGRAIIGGDEGGNVYCLEYWEP